MEGHFKTESFAPLYLGGIPNVEKQKMEMGLAIPGMLSFLAFNDFKAEVKGLDQFDRVVASRCDYSYWLSNPWWRLVQRWQA